MFAPYAAGGNFLLFFYLLAQSTVNARMRLLLVGYVRWRWSRIRGERASWDRPERFTAILNSYKRPWNMQRLVETMLRCECVERVIVTNNNPDVRVEDVVTTRHANLTLIDQPTQKGAETRFEIAADEKGPYFIAVDDDIFLRPSQITLLAKELLDDPTVPHGMFGTLLEWTNDEPSLRRGLWGFDGSVDIVNRAYFFTKEHARNFRAIVEKATRESLITENDVRICDDVLLSVTGKGRPLCHDVGPFTDCYSSTEKGIALFKTVQRFVERRTAILVTLQALVGISE